MKKRVSVSPITPSLCRAHWWAAAVLCVAGVLPARAADLPTIIKEALNTDPSILEARANEELAATRLKATQAQHYPVLGLQAGQNITAGTNVGTPFRGVAGRVNLFAAGAIDAAIARDAKKVEFQGLKTTETREVTAYSVAQLYLEALRAKEMLAVETRNLERHDRVVRDLKVIVDNDKGRLYELVQAEARALQVRLRMVQYEKTMKLSLSKLTRYTRQAVDLMEPIPSNWKDRLPPDVETRINPSVLAQTAESEAIAFEQKNLDRSRWPRLDLEAGLGADKTTNYARVQFNWNFLDRAADFNASSASKQLSAAMQRIDLIQRDVDQRGATAEADMAQSQLQKQVAQDQIGSSAKVVELYELQFKIGRRSLIELLNAYADLSGVEMSKTTAEADYRQAAVNYLYAKAVLADWMLGQAKPL